MRNGAPIEKPTASEKERDDNTHREFRRKFVRTCLGGMGVLTVGFTVAPVGIFLQPPRSLTAKSSVAVPLEELTGDQAIYREVLGTTVVIIPDKNEPRVFNASCTHLGCIVRWDHNSKTFVCPCHGAVFDSDGRPLKGPTNQPLAKEEYIIKDGKIIVG